MRRAPSRAVVERRIVRQADALIESMSLFLDTWGENERDRWFEALIIELGAVCRNLEADSEPSAALASCSPRENAR